MWDKMIIAAYMGSGVRDFLAVPKPYSLQNSDQSKGKKPLLCVRFSNIPDVGMECESKSTEFLVMESKSLVFLDKLRILGYCHDISAKKIRKLDKTNKSDVVQFMEVNLLRGSPIFPEARRTKWSRAGHNSQKLTEMRRAKRRRPSCISIAIRPETQSFISRSVGNSLLFLIYLKVLSRMNLTRPQLKKRKFRVLFARHPT